jgi:hypothetical protein
MGRDPSPLATYQGASIAMMRSEEARVRTRMLAYGAIGAWVAGGAASVAMLVMDDHERIEGGCLLLLSAAIALTFLWHTSDRNDTRNESNEITFEAAYHAGRADERREQEDTRRIRSARIDGIDATIVGGPNKPVDEETIEFIREKRAEIGGRR